MAVSTAAGLPDQLPVSQGHMHRWRLDLERAVDVVCLADRVVRHELRLVGDTVLRPQGLHPRREACLAVARPDLHESHEGVADQGHQYVPAEGLDGRFRRGKEGMRPPGGRVRPTGARGYKSIVAARCGWVLQGKSNRGKAQESCASAFSNYQATAILPGWV